MYAIEANTPVAELAATIVAENELGEIVTVVNAKVEDVNQITILKSYILGRITRKG